MMSASGDMSSINDDVRLSWARIWTVFDWSKARVPGKAITTIATRLLKPRKQMAQPLIASSKATLPFSSIENCAQNGK